jgi:hypothetical protein
MRWTARAVFLALLFCARQQAAAENEPRVITLSCDGTVTDTHITESKRFSDAAEVLPKVGVIVDLDKRTVSFLGYVAPITSVDPAYVGFAGEHIGVVQTKGTKIYIMGEIDRITGRIDATVTTETPTTLAGYNAVESHYEVSCKPTRRVF